MILQLLLVVFVLFFADKYGYYFIAEKNNAPNLNKILFTKASYYLFFGGLPLIAVKLRF